MNKAENFIKTHIELGDDHAVETALGEHQSRGFKGVGQKAIGLALAWAAKTGRETWVELLIPASCLNEAFVAALGGAAIYGHAGCVARLLAAAPNDPELLGSALCIAANHGHRECLRLLANAIDSKEACSAALQGAALKGHAACVELLIPLSDPSAQQSRALWWAILNGHAECVKLLAPVSETSSLIEDDAAIVVAARAGSAECVEALIPFPRAADDLAKAFSVAAEKGHHECVRLMLPMVDPMAGDSEALRQAANGGRAECVAMLIPVSDAQAMSAEALRLAARRGAMDCVELLLPASLTGDANNFGDRAARAAMERGHHDIARVIEDFAAAQRDRAALAISTPSGQALVPSIGKRL